MLTQADFDRLEVEMAEVAAYQEARERFRAERLARYHEQRAKSAHPDGHLGSTAPAGNTMRAWRVR